MYFSGKSTDRKVYYSLIILFISELLMNSMKPRWDGPLRWKCFHVVNFDCSSLNRTSGKKDLIHASLQTPWHKHWGIGEWQAGQPIPMQLVWQLASCLPSLICTRLGGAFLKKININITILNKNVMYVDSANKSFVCFEFVCLILFLFSSNVYSHDRDVTGFIPGWYHVILKT